MLRRGAIAFIFLLIMLGVTLLSPTPGFTQEKSVVVERRDAQITILPSGDVEVRETWVVNFSGGPFTRAYRSIPFNKVTRIDAWRISEEGQPYLRSDSGSAGTYPLVVEGGSLRRARFARLRVDHARSRFFGALQAGG